jgi:hypothetical protein
MNQRFEELTIETADDEKGRFIILTQNNCGNSESVAIHLLHLRYMAERFGLIETSDPQADKTITTLKRRLTALHGRIEHLQGWLANHSDHKHADLSYELTYATATLDIADEFIADFASPKDAVAMAGNNPQTQTNPSTDAKSDLLAQPVQLAIQA